MDKKFVSAGILTGGKSSRMGSDKAMLEKDGKSFLEIQMELFADFAEVLVSVAKGKEYPFENVTFVEDELEDYGPLEGIRQLLKASKENWVFVMATDLPFMKKEFIDKILSQIDDCKDYMAVIPCSNERVHVLSGLYSKDVLPLIEELISLDKHAIMALIDKIPVKFVNIDDHLGFEEMIININTPIEYKNM